MNENQTMEIIQKINEMAENQKVSEDLKGMKIIKWENYCKSAGPF